jgi:hypothetical protein
MGETEEEQQAGGGLVAAGQLEFWAGPHTRENDLRFVGDAFTGKAGSQQAWGHTCSFQQAVAGRKRAAV